ncbi:hypothetical protein OG539_15400 [Actinacidiphila glaucinigra]|uniref:hypothetical protein n=1 Tax=Actinacidiphila glaucinigra TaxID=235986 RepID=UPI00324A4FD7
MPIPRRSAAEALSRTLRRHGAAPDAVSDVGAAWEAFAEFLAVEVEGVEEADGDGFIAEWGRWDWNDDLPALSFGRLLAVRDTGGDAAHRQPEYWKVELQLCFAEDPAWADCTTWASRTPDSTTTPSVRPGPPRSRRRSA